MRKLVVFLSLTTALFAASTAWLSFRLSERHAAGAPVLAGERFAPTPAASAAAAPTMARATPGSPAVMLPNSTPGIDPPRPAGRAAGVDPNREMTTPFAKDFLRLYDDPALRAIQVANQRTGIEAQYSRLKDRLKLDDATYDQLITLLTEEFLEQQANYYRCVVNPACDLSSAREPRNRSDEYIALLGPERNEELSNYRRGLAEWQSVAQLRGRLSEANYLNDRDAERFMNALTDERERYMAETQQSGATSLGWGTMSGMLWYRGDGTPDQQLASATQYAERMRKRAATVLSPEQLRAYVHLQDELLAGFASSLRLAGADPG
jgi:hypothetical protein